MIIIMSILSKLLIVLNKVNVIIEHKRILQYTGSMFHLVPLLINIKLHNCLISNIWKLFNLLLLITNYLNHKYKKHNLYLIDLLIVIINCSLFIIFLLNNIRNIEKKKRNIIITKYIFY